MEGTDKSSGMGFGAAAIAIILLFGIFSRGGGGGGLFGGGNEGGNCNNNVGTRDILNTQFATTERLATQHAALSMQSASQFWNLTKQIQDGENERLKESLNEARMKNIQFENMLYTGNRFNAIENELCKVLKAPPVFATGCISCGTPTCPPVA